MKKTSLFFAMMLTTTLADAHRDSNIDNYNECLLNERALQGSGMEVSCNDLYHLYTVSDAEPKKASNLEIGAFNIFKLGSGDSRFKDYALTAQIMKNYDVIAVSEMHHSTSEEFDSNANLVKHPELDFKKYYHLPGYLKILNELKKFNKNWSLIISSVGQSDNEELLGFYFKADRVRLQNSDYCKEYNRSLREKGKLVFAGGVSGPKHSRDFESPHLNKSYGCLLDIQEDENSIFRLPFSARFKAASGFDFQMLSYHARYQAPIAVGGSCGFECLERVNSFLNGTFHKSGSFMGTLDHTSLRFLSRHLDFLSLKRGKDYALNENFGSVIKFKYSKPRIYKNMMNVKNILKTELPDVVLSVWEESYKDDISKSDRNKVLNNLIMLFSKLDKYDEFKNFIEDKGPKYKKFLKDIVHAGAFAELQRRVELWTSPGKIARFNEVAIVLSEMERIAKAEQDADVLLGGDINLEVSKNTYYWDFIRENYKYSTVAIGSPTSIGESNGLNSAFDHFIFNEDDSLEECQPLEANVLDFVNDRSHWKGFEHYFIKNKSELAEVSELQYKKIANIVYIDGRGAPKKTSEINVGRGYKSCWDGETYKPASLADVWKNSFECKTLNQFINGPQRFRLYTDLVSDHLPIGMRCFKTRDLD